MAQCSGFSEVWSPSHISKVTGLVREVRVLTGQQILCSFNEPSMDADSNSRFRLPKAEALVCSLYYHMANTS